MGIMKRIQMEEAEEEHLRHLAELELLYPDSDDPELDEELDRLLDKDD